MPDYLPILRHTALVRSAMLRRNQRLLNKITRDYLNAYRSLKSQIKTLVAAIADAQPTQGQLLRLAAMQSMLEGTRKEIASFTSIMSDSMSDAIAAEIKQAGVDTLTYVQLSLPGFEEAGLLAKFIQVQPEQVYQMFGFLDEYGPLYASLEYQFAPAAVEAVRDAIMSGYIQGMNPRAIAALINRAYGVPLNWALTMARTSSLWAYRSATSLNYRSNSDVIKGWMWMAQMDDRTCMSCISQHGSEHPLDEMLADHHNGRCTAVPITKSWEELGFDGIEDNSIEGMRDSDWYKDLSEKDRLQLEARHMLGEDWFKSLSPEMQKEMMGPGKWQAWQDGKFDFASLSKPYNDRIYGMMLGEPSLKSLLGDRIA